ncbi:hypothetical protein B296_00046409 [Ensete ventricosum]|uniref:Uncharacterized protein n=1 Tax=Ensete ventricosum TaxID=4639 RepID=A0A426Z3V3_ENSVE|nr:hypothetical protein B296_00046409 [Ensete ventricosum]
MVAIRCRRRRWVAEGGNNGGDSGDGVSVGMMVTTGSLLHRWRMKAKEMVGGGTVRSLMAGVHAAREWTLASWLRLQVAAAAVREVATTR